MDLGVGLQKRGPGANISRPWRCSQRAPSEQVEHRELCDRPSASTLSSPRRADFSKDEHEDGRGSP